MDARLIKLVVFPCLVCWCPTVAWAAEAPKPPEKNIALGQPYTVWPKSDYYGTGDDADSVQLTDGIYTDGHFWTQKSTVGWATQERPVEITIDLGSLHPIGGISYSSAAGEAGVGWPIGIFILVSDDGNQWWSAGELVSLSARNTSPSLESFEHEGYAAHKFWTNELSARGRYVKVLVVNDSSNQFTFCDEIEVFQGPDELLTLERQDEPVNNPRQAVLADKDRLVSFVVANQITADILRMEAKVREANLTLAERQRLEDELKLALAEAGETGEIRATSRLIMPFNQAHVRMLGVQAALWRAEGRPRFTVWQNCRWDPLQPYDTPQEPTAPVSIDLAMMGNECRGATFNITNAGKRKAVINLTFQGLPGRPEAIPDYITVAPVAWTGVARTTGHQPPGPPGGVTACALPEVYTNPSPPHGWTVEVPAGITQQVWLTFDSGDLPPGVYKGRLILTAEGAEIGAAPVSIRVANLEIPDELRLA